MINEIIFYAGHAKKIQSNVSNNSKVLVVVFNSERTRHCLLFLIFLIGLFLTAIFA